VYVLDTNILKLYFEQPLNYPYLVDKIREASNRGLLRITIVNAQEILAHAVNVIKDRPDQKEQDLLRLYDDLLKLIMFLGRFSILPFDKAAYQQFMAIGRLQTLIGTRDRRIAAISLS